MISRGLYGFAVSALPALLAISVIGGGGDVIDLAWILGVGAFPAILGAASTPMLLKRISQKSVFQIACAIWFVIVVTVGILDAIGILEMWLLIVVSFMLELAGSTLYPAIGSYLPQIVETSELRAANALRSVVSGCVSVAGPAVVGVAAVWGVGWPVWIGLGIVVGLAFAAQAKLPAGKSVVREKGALNAVISSWRFFRRSPGIIAIVAYGGLWHLLAWSAMMVIGPWSLSNSYNALWAWGIIESFFAGGLILGGFVAEKVPGSTQMVCIGSLFSLFPLLAGMALGWPLWVLFISAAFCGICITVGGVHWAERVQRETPEQMVPAVFSLEYILSDGVAPFGYLLVPALVLGFTASGVIWFAIAVCALPGVLLIIWFPKRFVAAEEGA